MNGKLFDNDLPALRVKKKKKTRFKSGVQAPGL